MALKAPVKNLYETIIILKPNLGDEDIEKNISLLGTSIKNYGGSVVKVDDPVRRKFTHKIKGFKDGFYISVLFNSPSDPIEIIKWKDVYETLEDAIDSCEDIANILEGIVLENA